jgi:hypothetical protein
MRKDANSPAKLTEPGGLLAYTTPSVFAALAYPDSISHLITHQAVAQEPWISKRHDTAVAVSRAGPFIYSYHISYSHVN